MAKIKPTEFWMTGAIESIPPLLQPVAHALLQSRREIIDIMEEFPEHLLWKQVSGLASPGFHLMHIPGVIDRLFTYAKAESLSQQQLLELAAEGKEGEGTDLISLLARLERQVDLALYQLKGTDPDILLEFRGVGKRQLPSTVMGLLFHTAEHCMRHTGQLLVTVQVLKYPFS